MSEMTEHSTSAKGMNCDWWTGDICTGERSPETNTSRWGLGETGGASFRRYKHTWAREGLLPLGAASENNSKYPSWHSCPNHPLNHVRGGLFVWVIWTVPDCFWNSSNKETDHRILRLPQTRPQILLLGRSDILPPISHSHATPGAALTKMLPTQRKLIEVHPEVKNVNSFFVCTSHIKILETAEFI